MCLRILTMKPQQRTLTHNWFKLFLPEPQPLDVVIHSKNPKEAEFKHTHKLENQASGKLCTAAIPRKLRVQKHCPSDV